MSYDIQSRIDWIEEELCIGIGGRWKARTDFDLTLHMHEFDGMFGAYWSIRDGILHVRRGLKWNGSNVVNDTEACLMASLFHDCVCGYITRMDRGWLDSWRMRKQADFWYARYCKWQGFTGIRAFIRYIGLRLRSLWPW